MSAYKITTEVLAEYLHCKYKAYLILTGVVSERSEYEHWLKRNEEQYGAAARSILVRGNSHLIAIQSLTSEHLIQGPAFIVDSHIQREHFAYYFDALHGCLAHHNWAHSITRQFSLATTGPAAIARN
jgi:hypothetical protein